MMHTHERGSDDEAVGAKGTPLEPDMDRSGDSGGGEDDASTEKEGDDRHLHEDQKTPSLKPSP